MAVQTFHELLSFYRRVGSTLELTEAEVNLMDETKMPAEHDYDYDDDSRRVGKPV